MLMLAASAISRAVTADTDRTISLLDASITHRLRRLKTTEMCLVCHFLHLTRYLVRALVSIIDI